MSSPTVWLTLAYLGALRIFMPSGICKIMTGYDSSSKHRQHNSRYLVKKWAPYVGKG